jgi:hypothetical protein
LVVNPGVITSVFVAAGLFGSVNSAKIATTWSTVGAAVAVALIGATTVRDAASSIAAATIFMLTR